MARRGDDAAQPRSAPVGTRQAAAYVGPWLPEPLIEPPGAEPDPADRITLDDSVRLAMLVVLERLTPAERAAFVLHDVFRFSFDEVGRIVGRSPGACRQLAARARRRIKQGTEPARFDVDPEQATLVAARFIEAATKGDLTALADVLDPDVVGWGDSGGVVEGVPSANDRPRPDGRGLRELRQGLRRPPEPDGGQRGCGSACLPRRPPDHRLRVRIPRWPDHEDPRHREPKQDRLRRVALRALERVRDLGVGSPGSPDAMTRDLR